MSVFAYTAIGRDGRQASGTVSADSRSAAISQVVSQGLHPVQLNEQATGPGATTGGGKAQLPAHPGKVSQKAVEAFTRELANLLAGGVPLSRAMGLLRREASNPAARYLWGAIHDDVIGGTPLADAMAKFPKNFSTVYVAMVRAGEAGGFLDVVLSQIAEFRTREQDLKGKVKAALIYPCILAIMAVLVVVFLLTFFIPRFSTIFAELGGQLPALTQAIIFASNVVASKYALVLAVVLGVGGFFLHRSMQTNTGRRRKEQVYLAIPILGTIIAQFALVRFSRMLGTLIGAGVPLVASLRVAREAIGNQTLADTVYLAIEEVQRGQSLSRSLGDNAKLFPASVVETIAVAEETGRLDKELVRVSASYEGDLDRQLRMLVSVAEPVLLFVMAALIGTIVVGMLLPIFKLNDLVNVRK
ncbi:MAG TPA: type II secretion system F family protein [Tepidisphaeraceae bacterium]|jgi:type II secretory pathway component PulF|nr:type II secretion system F family protein [Tepidisphaeraceae bacterium]